MSDRDHNALDGHFAEFRDTVEPHVLPLGTSAVRHTVRRRRRIAMTSTVAAALVLVVGPVAGYAALNRGQAPPPVGNPGPATSATSAPPRTGAPTPDTSNPATGQGGRIDRADLMAARVTIPAWPTVSELVDCPARNVRLKTAPADIEAVGLESLEYGDADGDGEDETIALLSCYFGEAGYRQVVVFDRDADGRILPARLVVSTHTGDGIENILKALPAEPTGVRVQVADGQPCCAESSEYPQDQWRAYTWNGTAFARSGGPGSFGPNPMLTDLSVTATDVTFTGEPGSRRGTITVTVENHGPGQPPYVAVAVLVGGGEYATAGSLKTDGAGWRSCNADIERQDSGLICVIRPPAPGESVTLTLGLRDAGKRPLTGRGQVKVDSVDSKGLSLPENGETNSIARIEYR